MVYQEVELIHMLSVGAFLVVHGISWVAAFRLRGESNVERVRRLLTLSRRASRWMYIPFMVVVVTGVILGFLANWWSTLWIWATIGVGFALSLVMSLVGTRYYDNIRVAVGLPPIYGRKENPTAGLASTEQLQVLLSSNRPLVLTAIGIGGIAAILWLMTVKPF